MMKLTLLFILLNFCTYNYAQKGLLNYSFKIEKEKIKRNKKLIKYKDSMRITLLYGYKNDAVVIKNKYKNFEADTSFMSEMYGICGYIAIPKKPNRRIAIFFNNTFIKKIRLRNKFSSVHLEYNAEKKKFIWRYLRYRFVFL